ncbi:MAG TPA: carboxyl transferase domain-containing protein [Actinomycetota bacterium]|nr:carboxyl transferase domain-containing protein [Actinomycetota bacterium]
MATTPTTSFDHVVDEGSFEPFGDDLSSTDPLRFAGYPDLLRDARDRTGHDESVEVGAATIGGHAVEVAGFDFSFLGGSMGEVAGERVARAIERAVERRVPFVLRTATGGARMQEGMRALVQMPKLVAARTLLAEAGLPYVAILGDPSTGGVLASVAALADYTVAETGAAVGFAGPRVVEAVTGALPPAGSHTAASALGNGLVDDVVDRDDVRSLLKLVLDATAPDDPEPASDPGGGRGENRDPWAAVLSARADTRPSAPDLARAMTDDAVELRGDRAGRDDRGLVALLGRVAGRRVLLLALDRAHLPGPGAFRKARRCLAVAVRLGLPVITLVDTRGADPSERAEAGGIAWEIAATFEALLCAPVPVVSVVTGEGGSGGALALSVGDRLLIYEDAIFSVIGPEAAASILWRDPGKAADAARALKPTARRLLELGIADAVVPEPPDAERLREVLAYHLGAMSTGPSDLSAARRARWRGTRG